MTSDDFILRLSKAEALVLFEFISRSDDAENFLFEDEAEQQVVWLLHAQLERALAEPLHPDYKTLLQAARTTVRDCANDQRSDRRRKDPTEAGGD